MRGPGGRALGKAPKHREPATATAAACWIEGRAGRCGGCAWSVCPVPGPGTAPGPTPGSWWPTSVPCPCAAPAVRARPAGCAEEEEGKPTLSLVRADEGPAEQAG